MKKLFARCLVFFLLLNLVPVVSSQGIASQRDRPVVRSEKTSLPRSSPEQQGIASTDLLGFIEAADKEIDTMNSFMLVRMETWSQKVGGILTIEQRRIWTNQARPTYRQGATIDFT